MPTARESKAALALLTGKAVETTLSLFRSTSGSAEARRAQLLDAVPEVVGYYSDGSSALAADFYEDERERAAAAGFFIAEPIVLDRTVKLRRAIVWAAEPLTKDLTGDVEKRLAEIIQLESARPYRDTILTNRSRDPQAVGWRRVTSGGCGFCQMLAGKGTVYRESTVRFAAHDHCGCTAAPVFLGGEQGPEVSVMQYVASKRSRTPEQRAALRDYLATYYPD